MQITNNMASGGNQTLKINELLVLNEYSNGTLEGLEAFNSINNCIDRKGRNEALNKDQSKNMLISLDKSVDFFN